MTLKTKLFQGWFAGATIFTCGALGDNVGWRYFDGSRIPWLTCMVMAIAIVWWGYGVINTLSASSDRPQSRDANE